MSSILDTGSTLKSDPCIISMHNILRMESSYWHMYTQPIYILYAYTILKVQDPDSSWRMYTGIYKIGNHQEYIWYLYGPDVDTIISSLEPSDFENEASFIMDDIPIYTAQELLKKESTYQLVDTHVYPMPSTKREMIRWLRRMHILDDDNVHILRPQIDDMDMEGYSDIFLKIKLVSAIDKHLEKCI